MHVLIDNCSLLNLVHSEGYGKFLTQLKDHVNRGNINLFTHELILGEWEKHKSANKKRIERKIRYQERSQSPAGGELLPSPNILAHVDNQYGDIDQLLAAATKLPTPHQVNVEFADRYRDRLAPFHQKRDSQNDWELFASGALYCEFNNVSDFYFISANTNEFSDPDEKKRTLHADLRSRFDKIKIHYFSELADFLDDLSNERLPDDLLDLNFVRSEKFSYTTSVRKNVLDSLFHLFKDTYEEVAYIPLHILKRYHPFAETEKEPAYLNLFTLNHVRPELVDMLSGVAIAERTVTINEPSKFSGIINVQEKLEYVLKRLTNNLVFGLSGSRTQSVDTRFHGGASCDCLRCTHGRLEWSTTLGQLTEAQNDLYDEMMVAYFHYQFGNYATAVKQFASIGKRAKTGKKYIIYYICQYNMRQLYGSLIHTEHAAAFTTAELSGIRAIDPFQLSVLLKSKTDYDLLIHIADAAFFKNAFDSIVSVAGKLEDHYQSCTNGGSGINSWVVELIAQFARLETFVSKNLVVYDLYQNWDRMFEQVLKGLFAAHALRDSESSHLRSFDDYLIGAIVFYGKRDVINKYFFRYRLKDLAYETAGNTDFLNMARNFLEQEASMKAAFDRVADAGNDHFYTTFNKVFQNLLTVAALLEDHAYHVDTFATYLHQFLKRRTSIDHWSYNAITGFFRRKGKLFGKRVRESLLGNFVKNINDEDFHAIIALLEVWPAGQVRDRHFNKIAAFLFDGADLRSRFEYKDLLTVLYSRSTESQKAELTVKVQLKLKAGFDFNLYYHALIYDIIPLDRKMVYKLVDEIPLTHTLSTGIVQYAHNRSGYFSRLDDLLNVFFKFRLPVKGPRFARFKETGGYYAWLLDMEGFDHQDLQIDWLTHHITDFYYQHMARSPKFKKKLIELLRQRRDPILEHVLIKISHFSEREQAEERNSMVDPAADGPDI